MIYEEYKNRLRRIADVNFSSAVLQWDQETYMPPKGAEIRAQQLSTLAGIAHELFVSPELVKLVETLNVDNSLSPEEKKNVTHSLKDLRRQQNYSTAFVEKMSRTVSEAFQSWQKAKEENAFEIFQRPLEKLVDLKKQECDLLGFKEHPYDAMIDLYEPGTTTSDVTTLFLQVRHELVPFVKKIAEAPAAKDAFMYNHYDKEKQWNFGLDLLRQMGYDFEAGRQDISSHPFTTNFNSRDVRVTTRISEDNISEMIWSCIHEGGHGLYEQGLLIENYGLPAGEFVSLGIHESQSRLWENNVGRSREYWQKNFQTLKEYFPESLKSVDSEAFYKAMNIVRPSLIRTNADELTYHFHVLIRFEIERSLLEGSIEVKDLPAVWNKKYKEYLGIDVPSDQEGVLQDVHWSHGSFGYFPTYSLGSFYAAQFYSAAEKAIPDLKKQIENGNLKELLNWLRENIHRHGKLFSASELCENITGEKLNFKYFMNYASGKYGELYNLEASN